MKWCGWSDSNRHSSRNQILSLARLPVPPHPHIAIKDRLVDYSFALYEEEQIRQQQSSHFLRIHIIFLSVLWNIFFIGFFYGIYSNLICKVFTS